MLTLSLGIALTRAALDWGESALEELLPLRLALFKIANDRGQLAANRT